LKQIVYADENILVELEKSVTFYFKILEGHRKAFFQGRHVYVDLTLQQKVERYGFGTLEFNETVFFMDITSALIGFSNHKRRSKVFFLFLYLIFSSQETGILHYDVG
jgi:hypothetical protein